MFSQYDCRILTLLFLLIGPLPSHGFFWPFTSWSKSSSSAPSSSSSSSFTDLLFRPYSDDLTALPSNSDSAISEFLPDVPNEHAVLIGPHGSDQFLPPINIPLEGGEPWAQSSQILQIQAQQQQPQQQQQQSGPQLPQQQYQEQIQQPFNIGRPQQTTMGGIQLGFPYQENLYDSKRLGYVSQKKNVNYRQQQQQQSDNQNVQNVNVPGSSRFVLPAENQYLIIPRPLVQSQQQQQQQRAERTENIEQANIPTQTINQQQQQQQQSQIIQSTFPSGNWVYLSPVNKLNSQQQPIIVEAYIEPGTNVNQASPQPQSFATKGTKTRQSTSSNNVQQQRGMKIPLLSWLPASPSQIHLPYWLKAKSQQHQQQQAQFENQNQQQQLSYQSSSAGYLANPNVISQKQIYLYTPTPAQQTLVGISGVTGNTGGSIGSSVSATSGSSGSISSYESASSGGNGGNIGGSYYIQTPSISQVQIKPSQLQASISQPQQQSIGSTNQILWADQNANQNPNTQSQFWIESVQPQQQSTRVQFPKQLSNNNVQEYQVIRTTTTGGSSGGSSLSSSSSSSNAGTELSSQQQSMVSQIDSNQDLGGWDSIPMPDIVKPGLSMDLGGESQQQQSQTDPQPSSSSSSSSPSLLSSASILDTVAMNETSIVQQQQPSHRIVYQALSSPTTSASNSSSVGGRSASSMFSSSSGNYQYSPIYQLIQQSQQQTPSIGNSQTNAATN